MLIATVVVSITVSAAIVAVLCDARADAAARERCLRLLALSLRVDSRSTSIFVFFQLQLGSCPFHVALLALVPDAAVATALAVHYESSLPSGCIVVCRRYATSQFRAHSLPLLRLCSAFGIRHLCLLCSAFVVLLYLESWMPRPSLAASPFVCAHLQSSCLLPQALGYVPRLVLSFLITALSTFFVFFWCKGVVDSSFFDITVALPK